MGRNRDLCEIFGIPEELKCPHCKEITNTDFEEYDIDCGKINDLSGNWNLDVQCDKCDHDFKFKFKVIIKDQETLKE